jgi:hypothetical protein
MVKLLSEDEMSAHLKLLVHFFILLILGFWQADAGASVRQKAFYVAEHGNDENPGTKALPWKTLKPVNQLLFSPDIGAYEYQKN